MAERSRGRSLIGMDHERRAPNVGDAQGIRPRLLEMSAQLALEVGKLAGTREQGFQLRLIKSLA